MDWTSQREIRELLHGLRLCLKALQPPNAMTLHIHGKNAAEEVSVRLRREIAYLEGLLVPK
jgi:hypothetical protein